MRPQLTTEGACNGQKTASCSTPSKAKTTAALALQFKQRRTDWTATTGRRRGSQQKWGARSIIGNAMAKHQMASAVAAGFLWAEPGVMVAGTSRLLTSHPQPSPRANRVQRDPNHQRVEVKGAVPQQKTQRVVEKEAAPQQKKQNSQRRSWISSGNWKKLRSQPSANWTDSQKARRQWGRTRLAVARKSVTPRSKRSGNR